MVAATRNMMADPISGHPLIQTKIDHILYDTPHPSLVAASAVVNIKSGIQRGKIMPFQPGTRSARAIKYP